MGTFECQDDLLVTHTRLTAAKIKERVQVQPVYSFRYAVQEQLTSFHFTIPCLGLGIGCLRTLCCLSPGSGFCHKAAPIVNPLGKSSGNKYQQTISTRTAIIII